MRPLVRIRSISAVDLQTIAIPVLNHPEHLPRDFANFQLAIHRNQPTLPLVVFRHGPGLQVVRLQALPDHFLTIVAADYQRRTVDIADIRDARWLEIDVIDVSVGETSPASSEPLYQLIIVHVDADHNWQAALATMRVFKDLTLKKSIQPARLSGGARESVEDETALAIRVTHAPSHHVANQVVGNQFATRHQGLSLHAQFGAPLYIRPQDVSGRDLRDAIMFGDPLSLCTLARARRTEQ